MACFSPKVYFLILLCTWLSCQFFVPSDSRVLFRRAAEGEEKSTNGTTEEADPCSEEKYGRYPCSSTITGNLLLMVFYGAILGVAAKCISDGAELLLDLGCSPSLIGGIVLPLLGAVPDSAIIIVSGLGPDAQEKLSVGMGTLAGSTIMLLTAAWAGSVAIGKCDLNAYDEAIEGSGYGKISCNRQGVTILPSIKTAVGIMLLTSLSYFIVQGADWHFGPHNFGPQPAYVRNAALATMIICFIGFIAYLIFLFVDSKSATMRADKHRAEMMQRKVLHQFVMMAKRQMPTRIGDHTDAEDKAAHEVHIQKKYFKAWRLGAGMDKKEAQETDPIMPKDGKDEKEGLIHRDSFEMEEEEEHEESTTHLAIKCVALLVIGVGLVSKFTLFLRI
ncbi:Alpha/beta hydrolase domain-containing protein 11 [Desmophyllum pertusum]|uniref:Alpha/beta hydrolase domain-containing protein 11 n=1 Tax=Desmophyllum pertusum TaxID=174260 RepID=A0A9W9ZTV2_9CNID|nr:Alpha/beta hydrolase domain-containing protein 11 [Desmophyllum pertusum]